MGDPTVLDWTNYFIGAGILIATVLFLGLQLTKQSKVSSANLILKLLKPWRETEFKEFLVKIGNHSLTKGDETMLEEFLNQLESISIFWKDGTINENHIKEFFGTNIKAVRDDKFIQSYMKIWVDKKPDYYFVNLRELIKKVDGWKI